MRPATLFLAVFSMATLSACGGGGGGGGSAPRAMPQETLMPNPEPMVPAPKPMMPPPTTPSMPIVPPPTPMMPQIELHQRDFTGDLTEGSKSTEAEALAKLRKHRETGILSQLQRPTGAFTLNPFFAPVNLHFTHEISFDTKPQAALDTQANLAWAEGWTGKGVKVAVVDDYRTDIRLTNPRFAERSHGYFTRGIAAQVAPEAAIQHYQIDLGGSSSSLAAIFSSRIVQYDKAETAGAFIVNSSFGHDYFRRGPANQTTTRIQTTAKQNAQNADYLKYAANSAAANSYDENMLFVFAAGNGGASCRASPPASRHMDICTLRGAALLKLRGTDKVAGDRVMFVGSLSDNANLTEVSIGSELTDELMADYSYHAGKLKYDFIVAHDDIWQDQGGSGTSYAAPRVTGAAALVRHKFPNLNGAQLKQVLVQSAEDLGDEGPDPIYGAGKLNILGALSPIRGLTE